MSTEVHVSSRTLAIRTNGVFSATDRGRLAHELVRIHKTTKNNSNPKIAFAMNEEQTEKCVQRREELCSLLGLPSDEKTREKKIQGFDGRLMQLGLPYYRINIK